MKKMLLFSIVAILALGTAAWSQKGAKPKPQLQESTFLQTDIKWDIERGYLAADGAIRIVHPSKMYDREIVTRLLVVNPKTMELVHSEELTRFLVTQNSPENQVYPIHFRRDLDVVKNHLSVCVYSRDDNHGHPVGSGAFQWFDQNVDWDLIVRANF
jgi:hypothetical protein